jgi:hypothetical protein
MYYLKPSSCHSQLVLGRGTEHAGPWGKRKEAIQILTALRPVIPVLTRLRQKDLKFQASMGYIVTIHLNNNKIVNNSTHSYGLNQTRTLYPVRF